MRINPWMQTKRAARAAGLTVAVLSASFALAASADVQLLPAGAFSARDGRPGGGKQWQLTDASGRAIAARLNETAALSAFVFDVDHQTVRAAENGQPAPAAGWATRFEWRDGIGLFATDVRWTEQARSWIEQGAYRYVSPVITFDASGAVTAVLMAAITNFPALLGMDAIGQDLAAQLAGQFEPEFHLEQSDMNDTLKKLLARLGLPETTTEAEALSALDTKLAASAAAGATPALSAALCGAIGLQAGADEAAALAAIAKLGAPDAGSLQAIAALQGQLATLTAQINGQTVESLVAEGLKDGRIQPAVKDYFTNLGRKDLAALQGFLATAPKLPAGTQTEGRDPGTAGGLAALSADVKTMLRAMNVTEADYLKSQSERV